MIEWAPAASDESLKVAVPLVRETVLRDVVPSMKVTLPVGVPLPEVGATVAVNVTGCPKTAGLVEAFKFVVVGAWLATTAIVLAQLLPFKVEFRSLTPSWLMLETVTAPGGRKTIGRLLGARLVPRASCCVPVRFAATWISTEKKGMAAAGSVGLVLLVYPPTWEIEPVERTTS